jgi:hypothetical protein
MALEGYGLGETASDSTIADLRARVRREVDFTLECSGNTGTDNFIGGIGAVSAMPAGEERR